MQAPEKVSVSALVRGVWRLILVRWRSKQDVLDLLVGFVLWAMALGYVGDEAGPGFAGDLIGATGLFLAFFLAKLVRVPAVEGVIAIAVLWLFHLAVLLVTSPAGAAFAVVRVVLMAALLAGFGWYEAKYGEKGGAGETEGS